MKTVSSNLQAHLDTGATTMCFCWRLIRQDAVTQGFTDHDEDLVFGGTTFLASAGFTASQVSQSLGLSVDNLNVDGALSDASLNEDDLASGVYDSAEVELYWVNWKDVSERILLNKGALGEVKRRGLAFSAELRGLAHYLQQKTGRTFQRYCDAVVGDSRCGINLNTGTYKGSGTTVSVSSSRVFTASGLGSFDTDWFSAGVLEFTSGDNDGQRIEVKTHTKSASGTVTVELWFPPPFDVAVSDTFDITAGCKQDAGTCHTKFNNLVNFRGFNLMPGVDTILWYPTVGGSNQGGGSLLGN